MKNTIIKFFLYDIFIIAAMCMGCIALPKFPAAPPPPAVAVQGESPVAPSRAILPSFFEPAKTPARIAAPKTTLPDPKRDGSSVTQPGTDTPAASPAAHSIQIVVNWFATLFILGGLALLGLGIFLIVNGHVVPGIKLVLCGLLVPIFGIWFAFHWLFVVIVTLLVVAALELSAHYVLVAPLLAKIETHAQAVVKNSLTPFLEKL